MKAKIAITVDQEVLKEINRLRGMATRSTFANHILTLGLKTYKAKEKQTAKECTGTNLESKANAKS